MNTNLNSKECKVSLILGITGMDGSYLTELLLSKGYIVHGVIRRTSTHNTSRLDHIYQGPQEKNKTFFLHYGDITDSLNITNLIKVIQPDEIYQLSAQSHVKVSFEIPEYTANVDAIGTLRVLEAVRIAGLENKVKIYNACTSELYGRVQEIPQNEETPFNPLSPYATAKLYSLWIARNYRESYGMFISNGILFNHTGPRRGETFVCRKITIAVAKISHGLQDKLYLGNIDSERDFGSAEEYVYGMWLMLQQDKPDDFVLATNRKISIRKFVELSFKEINIDIIWKGEGVNEKGYNSLSGDILVEIDPKYFRPNEVDLLLGDYSKAKRILGWEPKITVENLIKEMVQSDIKLFEKDKFLKTGGYEIYNNYE